ncbi:MAG: hypothetical protein RR922_04705 [Clostridia bacterium]
MNNELFNFINNNKDCFDNVDINKLLVILLLLLGKLNIEYVQIFKNDFSVTLGTFENTF